MNKISGIYKITNTITGDFYIGSSKDVKRRWKEHKCPSNLNKQPNNPMYLDMKKYGVDKFVFEVLAEVEAGSLKVTEQKFIELLKPTYNNINTKGIDIEKYKDMQKKARKKFQKTDKYKEYYNIYYNKICCYNGETMTLAALSTRFRRQGITHPVIEAKKYLI